MDEDHSDIDAALASLIHAPRRDNRAYHAAMASARRAFEEAEAALGGPVTVKARTKLKRNGDFVVKWTFRRV